MIPARRLKLLQPVPPSRWGTASHLTPLGTLLLSGLLTVSLVVLGLLAAVSLGHQRAVQQGFVDGAFSAGEHVVQAAGKLEALVSIVKASLH